MNLGLRKILLWAPAGVLLVFCFACRRQSSPATGFDWPRWRGPNGDGVSLETDWNPKALEGGARVLWQRNIGLGYSAVAVAGGRVFTAGCTGADNAVFCLDAETGNVIWRFSRKSTQDPQATPTLDRTSVYFLMKEGILLCLNRKNGRMRWRRDLVGEYGARKPHYGFAGSPVVEGDIVLINANASGMALQKSSGRLLWASEKPPEALEKELGDDNGVTYMTPVVYSGAAGRRALVYSWKGLSAMDIETGELIWRYPWLSYILAKTPDPVLIGDKILIADDNGGDYYRRFSTLLRMQDGAPTVLWQSPELYSDVTTPVVIDGYIYGPYGGPYSVSLYSSLRCLRLDDGRLMWKHPEENQWKKWISLTAAGRNLIVLEESGKLSVIEASPEAYREVSACVLEKDGKRYGKFFTPPVLCNGRVYCRNYSGELFCIDLRS